MLGENDIAHLYSGDDGILSCHIYNPLTDEIVFDSTVVSVRYEAVLDVRKSDSFQLIGISTNSASDFSLDWVATGFEPLIMATPLDISGNPVYFNGVDGYNHAVGDLTVINCLPSDVTNPQPCPEPSTVIFFGVGALGIAYKNRIKIA